ncbi:MAG: hypothetical protein IT181_07110 [Acidobacteria bacterium]|nr:hypothetical protein [Acidobacteriota bacterium]
MLQELTASTGASLWAIASMLFFIAVYLVVTVRVVRAGNDELDARARMALDPPSPEASEGRLRNDGSQDDAAPQGVR